jgi:hypothetical protein
MRIVLKLSDISTYLSYSVSCITALFGAVILSGVVFPYVPSTLRITFGIVLMLWGIYRFIATRTQIRQQNEKDEEE